MSRDKKRYSTITYDAKYKKKLRKRFDSLISAN